MLLCPFFLDSTGLGQATPCCASAAITATVQWSQWGEPAAAAQVDASGEVEGGGVVAGEQRLAARTDELRDA